MKLDARMAQQPRWTGGARCAERLSRTTWMSGAGSTRDIDRVLQCVSPAGVVSSVFTMIASNCSSEIVRGAPTRGSAFVPLPQLKLRPTCALT